ncbi:MAG: phasin family protein [Myxococcaceae bacterium]
MGAASMESKEQQRRPVAEYFEKVWGDLEKNVEEGVKKALSKVKAPKREEIAELTSRIDSIERRLDALLQKRK